MCDGCASIRLQLSAQHPDHQPSMPHPHPHPQPHIRHVGICSPAHVEALLTFEEHSKCSRASSFEALQSSPVISFEALQSSPVISFEALQGSRASSAPFHFHRWPPRAALLTCARPAAHVQWWKMPTARCCLRSYSALPKGAPA